MCVCVCVCVGEKSYVYVHSKNNYILQAGMDARLKAYHIGTGVGGRVYGSAWDDLVLFLNECLPSAVGYVTRYVCMYIHMCIFDVYVIYICMHILGMILLCFSMNFYPVRWDM